MSKQEADSKDNIVQFKTSHFEQNSVYNFKWIIESYLELPTTCTLETSKFHPMPDRVFSASFSMIGTDCDLEFCLKSGPDILIEHLVSVTDSSGTPSTQISLKDMKHLYREGDDGDESYCFSFSRIDLKQLVTEANEPVLVLNCTMKLILLKTEEIQPKSSTIDQRKQPPESSTVNLSALTDNFKAMLSDSKHTDITLQVNDESVSSHKSVLSARSPVFDKLLNKQVDKLTISDIEIPALKDLLEFLYTGTVTNIDFEPVFQLYHAAYQYEVDSLQSTCVNILLSKLDVNNACRLLVHADDHRNKNFKGSVIEFIKLHYDEIDGTDVFVEFGKEHPCLAVEVMQSRIQMFKKDKLKD